jgi:serine/threonine-protein kinase
VAAAHDIGVVHRDLKPGNIIIAQRGRCSSAPQPVVLDFGISKTADDDDAPLTRSGSLLGTVHYMSPEQTRGAKFATPLSDQYALGVMLYECATGTLPFQGEGAYELMHAIVTAPMRPPSSINPEISAAFDAIVLRAMDRNPEKRFPSVEALGSALLSLGGRTSWILWGREFTADRNDSAPAGETQGDDGPITDTLQSAAFGSRAAKGPLRRPRRGLYAAVAGMVLLAIFVVVFARQRFRVQAIAEETAAARSVGETELDPGSMSAMPAPADPTNAAIPTPSPTLAGNLGENSTTSPARKVPGARRAAGSRTLSTPRPSAQATPGAERGDPSHVETGSNNAPILE